MLICQQNLLHAQKPQKQTHDKKVKPKSYILDKIVELNSNYIRTKWNWKLIAKVFGPFQVLHFVEKQVYKLKLLIQ